MTFLHKANGLVRSVVWNSWRLMENTSNSVTGIGSDDGVSMWLNCVGDDISDLAVHLVWLAICDGGHQTFVGLDD